MALLSGLPGDMPLPTIIGIRTATDKEMEYMSASARKARDDWYLWLAGQEAVETGSNSEEQLEALFKSMFGG